MYNKHTQCSSRPQLHAYLCSAIILYLLLNWSHLFLNAIQTWYQLMLQKKAFVLTVCHKRLLNNTSYPREDFNKSICLHINLEFGLSAFQNWVWLPCFYNNSNLIQRDTKTTWQIRRCLFFTWQQHQIGFFLVHHKSEVKGVFRTALQMCLSHKMGK